MSVFQLDILIRVGALTTTLLLAWILLRQRGQIGLPAVLFAPLAICLSGFLVGNTPFSPVLLSGLPAAIASAASGFTVIFLWWFCLSCFDRRFRLRGPVLAVGLIWAVIAALDRGLLGERFAALGLSRLLVAMGFGIVAHLVWRLVAERPGDLLQRRHDARILVAVLLGGILFVDLAADAIFGFAWRPLAFSMAQNMAIFGVSLWLVGKIVEARPSVLAFDAAARTAPADSASSDGEDAADGHLAARLKALIETDRIFLDPDLTFAMFVQRMAAPERTVRRLINHQLGFDHFRTFLNHYRVAEARRLLGDRRKADDKLIAIAFDSGFASLASFNRAFLALEGRSPSAYRAALATGATF